MRASKGSLARLGRLFAVAVLVGVVLSFLAGWLWVTLAAPPRVPLAPNGGLLLGEQALNQQSGITLWFMVIGAGFGAGCGLAFGWAGERFGPLTVVAVLALCAVAAFGSSYLGVHLFGPDPSSEVIGAKVGDLIRINVSLDSWVAYLGWPIGGLLGVTAAISGWRTEDISRDAPFVGYSPDDAAPDAPSARGEPQ